jgi:hypothetical protein
MRQSGANGDRVSRQQHTESALPTLANIANYSLQLSGRLPGRGAAFRRGWYKRHFDSTIKRKATWPPPQVKMDFGSDAAIVSAPL